MLKKCLLLSLALSASVQAMEREESLSQAHAPRLNLPQASSSKEELSKISAAASQENKWTDGEKEQINNLTKTFFQILKEKFPQYSSSENVQNSDAEPPALSKASEVDRVCLLNFPYIQRHPLKLEDTFPQEISEEVVKTARKYPEIYQLMEDKEALAHLACTEVAKKELHLYCPLAYASFNILTNGFAFEPYAQLTKYQGESIEALENNSQPYEEKQPENSAILSKIKEEDQINESIPREILVNYSVEQLDEEIKEILKELVRKKEEDASIFQANYLTCGCVSQDFPKDKQYILDQNESWLIANISKYFRMREESHKILKDKFPELWENLSTLSEEDSLFKKYRNVRNVQEGDENLSLLMGVRELLKAYSEYPNKPADAPEYEEALEKLYPGWKEDYLRGLSKKLTQLFRGKEKRHCAARR